LAVGHAGNNKHTRIYNIWAFDNSKRERENRKRAPKNQRTSEPENQREPRQRLLKVN
jgi:hypothetical protein